MIQRAVFRWKQNHGNLLLLFFVLISAAGSAIIAYQQTRFIPPRFPESEMIEIPPEFGDGTQFVSPGEIVAIRIMGAANNQGTIKAAIHTNAKTFQSENEALLLKSLPLEEGETVWLIPVRLLPEKFAVAAYHDENNDQQLTMNRLGIPTERYGFTRDVRGMMGPPRFEDAVIDRPNGGEQLFVFVR